MALAGAVAGNTVTELTTHIMSSREATVDDEKHEEQQHRVALPFDKFVLSPVTIQTFDRRFLMIRLDEDGHPELVLTEPLDAPPESAFFRNICTPNQRNAFQAFTATGKSKDPAYLTAMTGANVRAEIGFPLEVGRGRWKPAEFEIISKDSAANTFYIKTHYGYFVGINGDDELCPMATTTDQLDDSSTFTILRRDRAGVFNPNRQRSVTVFGSNFKYCRPASLRMTEKGENLWEIWLRKNGQFGFAVCDIPLAARREHWTSHPVRGKKDWIRLGPPQEEMADAFLYADPDNPAESALTFVLKNLVRAEIKKKELHKDAHCDLALIQRTQFKVLWRKDGKCALRTFDGRYIAWQRVENWQQSLVKETENQKEADFQIKGRDHGDDVNMIRMVAIKEINERAEWKIEEVPSVRWFYNVHLNQLSSIDVRQNSFKVDAEVLIFRQMLSSELRLWLADPELFSDSDLKINIGFTPKCKEIILMEQEIYADGKPFQVLWLGLGQCFWIITRYRLCAEYTEALELTSFPFDVQHLEFCMQFDALAKLNLTVYDVVDGELKFDERKDRWQIVGGTKVAIKKLEWRPDFKHQSYVGFTMPVTAVSHIPDYDLFGIQRTVLPNDPNHGFVVILQRSWKFYFRKVISVLMIISFMSMCALITRDEENLLIDDPLSYLSTMLLTIVAFMIILKEDLPALKEPSLLDRYLIAILIFVFLLGMSFVIFDPLEFAHDSAVGYGWMYNECLWFFCALWVVIHIVFLIWAITLYRRECEKRLHTKAEVDEIEDEKSGIERQELRIEGVDQNPDFKYFTNTTCSHKEYDEMVADRIERSGRL